MTTLKKEKKPIVIVAVIVLAIVVFLLFKLFIADTETENTVSVVPETPSIAPTINTNEPIINEEKQEDVITQDEIEMHNKRIYAVFPDADNIVNSEEFAAWLSNQSPDNQAEYNRIMQEGTSNEVIYMLRLFDNAQSQFNELQVYKQQRALREAQAREQVRKEREEYQQRLLESQSRQNAQLVAQQQELERQIKQQAQQHNIQSNISRNYIDDYERERLTKELTTVKGGAHGLTAAQLNALAALQNGQTPIENTRPPSQPAIASCDEGGCWDTSGTRYNKGGGNTYFSSDGKTCVDTGAGLHCN